MTFALNLASLFFAIAVVAVGSYLCRFFRGGLFAKPFIVLLLAPLFFFFAGVSDLLGNMEVNTNLQAGLFFFHLHDAFQFVFLVIIFSSVVLFYRSVKALGTA